MREIDRKKMKHTMRCLKNALFLTGRVTAVCGKQTEIGTVVFRTAIETEILFAARVMQVRFFGAVIKPVHPCTGLIARFAQQNALLLRTTDIRVGTEKKHRGNKTAAAKRLERYGAAEPTGVASKQARCCILFSLKL